MSLTNETVLAALQEKLGKDLLAAQIPQSDNLQNDQLTVTLRRDSLVETLRFLKEHPDLQFNFLTDICGIHYPENPANEELGVIYHLHSWTNNYRLRLKTFVSRKDTKVPSACPVFSCANWMERETYDFFGIQFTGHPNLKRILNVDEMDFFPLRKEYPLEEQTRTDKNDKMFGR